MSEWTIERGLCDFCYEEIQSGASEYRALQRKPFARYNKYWKITRKRISDLCPEWLGGRIPKAVYRDDEFKRANQLLNKAEEELRGIQAVEDERVATEEKTKMGMLVVVPAGTDEDGYEFEVEICARHLRAMLADVEKD